MAADLPVTKTLIKNNSYSSEENDEEEKEPIDIEITEQKDRPEMMKFAIDFRWSGVKEERRGRYC